MREPFDRASLNTLTRRICRTGEAANVVVSKQETKGPKYASAHDLRRSFGFRWAGKCRRPSALQALMRHSSIVTTMTYYATDDAQALADELWLDNTGNYTGSAPETQETTHGDSP